MAVGFFKKGSVEMLVLFLLCRGDSHRYQLVKDIQYLSQEELTLQAGSLYPILHWLEDNQYVTSTLERVPTKAGSSRIRVSYHIEPPGRERLQMLRSEYESVHRGIHFVFDSGAELDSLSVP